MKILLVGAVLLSGICIQAATSHAFRCGDGGRLLASEGMHKYQILKDCGPPLAQEVVGIDKRVGSERIIEEWLYLVEEGTQRQYYLIRFDRNGVAESIEWLGPEE
jgi:hypothetical protein